MAKAFIEAVGVNNIILASEILRKNSRITKSKSNFDVIKLINSTKMLSMVLKHFGHELIKFHTDRRISILVHALKKGKSLKIIDKIVSCNKDTINQVSSNGITPLIYAVKMNLSINVIKYIISKNGDVNRCCRGGQSPLHFARNAAVTKLLIKSGANVNCTDKSGSTPLMTLIKSRKNKKGLFYLLQHGADINISNNNGQNALHLALKLSKSSQDVVLKILEKIDAIHLYSKDKMGYTPMHYAFTNSLLSYNEEEKQLISLLLNKRCKLSKKVFMFGLTNPSFTEILNKLVDYVDIKNCFDSSGRNVLHLVYDVNLVKLLVRKGALINHCDNSGKTPLLEAITRQKSFAVIEALLSFGAKEIDFYRLFYISYYLYIMNPVGNLMVDLLVLHGSTVSLKNKDTKNFVSRFICTYVNENYINYSMYVLRSSLFKHIFISNENIIIPEVQSGHSSSYGELHNEICIYKNEFHKMKQTNILGTTSFYHFCLSEFKSPKCCVDESKCRYVIDNFKKIEKDFPIFFAQIVIKIKMNLKFQKRRKLLNKLLCITVKYVVEEPVDNIYVRKLRKMSKGISLFNFIELNCDCLYNVGNYLHDHELKCLLAASM